MRTNEEGEIYIDEKHGGNINDNEVLINTRREGTWKQDSLAALVTGNDEEFIIPRGDLKKYVTDGVLTGRPDESWMSKFWFSYDRDNPERMMNTFVVQDKFEMHHKDDPFVRLAKRVLNPQIPIQFNVRSQSDRRRLRERIKEIEKNELSSKQFFKLMKIMGLKVDCTVWSEGADRDEGFTETIV